ncbi:sporulation protein YunB [Oceanobacillus sp. CAU 1775]
MRKKRLLSPPGQRILLFTIIIFILCVGASIIIIDRGIKPTLMEIAKEKTTAYATRGINAAVRFAEEYDFNDIANITYDNGGNVAVYRPNFSAINEINRQATNRVEEFFARINHGDPITHDSSGNELYDYPDGAEERILEDPTLIEIPLGQVTGNTVLANLGPRIPINLEVIGTVRTNIVPDRSEFGINSAWVSFYLHVEADVQIIIPFTSEVTTVTSDIYIDGGAIMGEVPEFYGGGMGPSIAVPREDFQNNLHGGE